MKKAKKKNNCCCSCCCYGSSVSSVPRKSKQQFDGNSICGEFADLCHKGQERTGGG